MLFDQGIAEEFNAGVRAQVDGRLAEAAEIYSSLWDCRPDLPGLGLSNANVLLSLGDARGWKFLDQRPERLRSEANKLGFPEWRGESLAGKRLFVWPKQGLGDQIFAARYLRRTGAGQVVVCWRPDTCGCP